MDTSLDALLADYKERNADYRRQLRLYTTSLTTASAFLAVTTGWVLSSSPGERPYWVLPLGVALTNIALMLMLFVFRVTQLVYTYILALEKGFNELVQSTGIRRPIHHVDRDDHPSLFVGYYLWDLQCREASTSKAWRLFLRASVTSVLVVFESLILYFGLTDPVYRNSALLWCVVGIVLIAPCLCGAAILAYQTSLSTKARQSALNGPRFELPNPSQEVVRKEEIVRKITLVDFEQRNEDARFLFDYYVTLMLWAVAGITALTGLWVDDPSRGWVFLLIPPMILSYAFAGLLIYRLVKRLKRYLVKVEREMDVWLQQETLPSLHTGQTLQDGFYVGMFRLVRSRHVQAASSLGLPLHLAIVSAVASLLALMALVLCASKGLEWIDSTSAADVFALSVWYWVGLGLLLAGNILTLILSAGVGRDPVQKQNGDDSHVPADC